MWTRIETTNLCEEFRHTHTHGHSRVCDIYVVLSSVRQSTILADVSNS